MCCRSCRSFGPLRGQCFLTGGESWAAYFDVASACCIVGSWIVGWPAFLNLHEKWPFVVQKMFFALFLAQNDRATTWFQKASGKVMKSPAPPVQNCHPVWSIPAFGRNCPVWTHIQQHWFSFPHVPRLGWRERKKTALADDGITSIISCNLSLQPLHFPYKLIVNPCKLIYIVQFLMDGW